MSSGPLNNRFNVYPEAYVTGREIYAIDLGPTEETAGFDISPDTETQEDALDDATSLDYIDTRVPDGSHCMDDRIVRPGIQLPGGLGETLFYSRRLTPGSKYSKLKKSDGYRESTQEAIEMFRTVPWWHERCAAQQNKKQSAQTLARHPEDAAEFVYDGMVKLDLIPNTTQMAIKVSRRVNRSIYIANERFDNDDLDDVSDEEALDIALEAGGQFEPVEGNHNVVGAIVEYAGNRFNNDKFMKDHTIHGRPVGALVITPGAYRNLMFSRGFEDSKIERESMNALLCGYAVLKLIWSHYVLPTGIAGKK